jgi:hypothetical protein
MLTNSNDAETISAAIVPGNKRVSFMARHLGPEPFETIRREAVVYAYMRNLSPDYRGGAWSFYELSNGGFFMAPDHPANLHIQVNGNGYSGEMSAQAAGIVVTLFAVNHFAFEMMETDRGEMFANAYYSLLSFSREHVEGPEIAAAID